MDFSILTDHLNLYLEGFKNTVIASLIALVCSFFLGTLIAVMRIAPIKPLNWMGTIYVELFRNIPVLIITFFFYFGLASIGVAFDGLTSGTIALTVYTASFIAEAIRAGIVVCSKRSDGGRTFFGPYIQSSDEIHYPYPRRSKLLFLRLATNLLI